MRDTIPRCAGNDNVRGAANQRQLSSADQLVVYAECVYDPDDLIEVRLLPCKFSRWVRAAELPQQAAILNQDNAQGQNVYAGVNPRKRWGGRKTADVALARVLVADFDGITETEATRRWAAAGLPEPTLIIASGHGTHIYLQFTRPIARPSAWRTLQRRLIAAVGSDVKVHDPPRILRLPGFTNHKEPVAVARIVHASPGRTASVATIRRKLRGTQTQEGLSTQPDTAHTSGLCQISREDVPGGDTAGLIDAAIRATLPTGYGQRHNKLFILARALKAIPELAHAEPEALRPLFERWHTAALPNIRKKDFLLSWTQFLRAWRNAKRPLTQTGRGATFAAALTRAAVTTPPACAARYADSTFCLLICLCRELQALAGDAAFPLGCRKAGEVLGISHETAASMIRLLVQDGILTVASTDTEMGRRAYEYRYTGTD
jgi:hypothetical protein